MTTDLTVTFKAGVDADEYDVLCPRLRPMIEWLAHTLDKMGCDTQITSMLRVKGEIVGESGVHATGRAIDLVPRARPEKPGRIQTIEMTKVADMMNIIWRRNDQHKTCIWHNFNGGGFHFHVQVPWGKDYADLKGKIPETAQA